MPSSSSSTPGQLGLALQPLLLGHDGQPEVDGEHHEAQRLVVLRDEVLERGHDAVAGPALVDGVVQAGVEPAARASSLRPGACPAARRAGGTRRGSARARSRGRAARRASTRRGGSAPAAARPRRRGTSASMLELVVDGVPVVVAVDEGGVHRVQRLDDVEAEVPVEDVLTVEAALVLGRDRTGAPGRSRAVRPRGRAASASLGRLARQRADLGDLGRAGGLEHRRDRYLPEWKHRTPSVVWLANSTGATGRAGTRRRSPVSGAPRTSSRACSYSSMSAQLSSRIRCRNASGTGVLVRHRRGPSGDRAHFRRSTTLRCSGR